MANTARPAPRNDRNLPDARLRHAVLAFPPDLAADRRRPTARVGLRPCSGGSRRGELHGARGRASKRALVPWRRAARTPHRQLLVRLPQASQRRKTPVQTGPVPKASRTRPAGHPSRGPSSVSPSTRRATISNAARTLVCRAATIEILRDRHPDCRAAQASRPTFMKARRFKTIVLPWFRSGAFRRTCEPLPGTGPSS